MTRGIVSHSRPHMYAIAVETAGRLKTVEQNRPKVPIMNVVTTNTRRAVSTCAGDTPPKKKTRLNRGAEAAISSSAFASPATSLPETSEKDESREHKSRS